MVQMPSSVRHRQWNRVVSVLTISVFTNLHLIACCYGLRIMRSREKNKI